MPEHCVWTSFRYWTDTVKKMLYVVYASNLIDLVIFCTTPLIHTMDTLHSFEPDHNLIILSSFLPPK